MRQYVMRSKRKGGQQSDDPRPSCEAWLDPCGVGAGIVARRILPPSMKKNLVTRRKAEGLKSI